MEGRLENSKGRETGAGVEVDYLPCRDVISLTPMAQESVEGDEAPLHLRWCHASCHGVRARVAASHEACPQS